MLLRHKLLIAVAAVIAVASAGGAYPATQDATSPNQTLVNDVAKRLHVSPAQLTSALRAALIDRLNEMVQDGRLTQAQAKRIEKRINSGRLPMFFDHPGHMGFRDHGLVRRGALDAAGNYLGLTDAKLLADLSSGKTLAQIAQSRGKSVSGLEQALMTNTKDRLDRLVSAGVISKAEEQRDFSRLSAKIGRLLTRSWPAPLVPPMPPDAHGPSSPPIGFGTPATE
jgi:AraC-like DNA-binding protein